MYKWLQFIHDLPFRGILFSVITSLPLEARRKTGHLIGRANPTTGLLVMFPFFTGTLPQSDLRVRWRITNNTSIRRLPLTLFIRLNLGLKATIATWCENAHWKWFLLRKIRSKWIRGYKDKHVSPNVGQTYWPFYQKFISRLRTWGKIDNTSPQGEI